MPNETKEQLKGKIDQLEKEVEELKEAEGDADKYATIGSRVAATVIDVVLVFGFWLIIIIILPLFVGVIGAIYPPILDNDILYLGISILLLFCPFGYFIILEGGIGKGQTIGKRLLHIKVIKENGETPTYFQSFIRTFTRFLDLFFIYHIIGLIAASLTERRQRIGDILAKTLVVKENVTSPPKSKAEQQSGAIIVVLAIFVFLMMVLMVLIVGIVLWQLGVFSGIESSANKSTGFNVLAPIDKTIYSTASDETLTYIMENRAGNTITIQSIDPAYDLFGGCTGETFTIEGIDVKNNEVIIKPGKSVEVQIGGCTGMNAGDRFSIDLELTYTEKVAGRTQTHTETGTIRGRVEV